MFTKLVVVMVMIVVCNYEYGDIQIGNESWSSQGYALHPCAVQENLAKAEIQMKTSNLVESNKSLLKSLNTKSQRFQIYLNNQTDFLEHKSKSHPLSAYSTFTNFASRGMTRRIKHSIPFDIDVLPTKTCYCWLNSA